MSEEGKRSLSKAWMGWVVLGLAILVSLAMSGGSAAHGRAKQADRQKLPLGELLQAEGTCSWPGGFWGSQGALGLGVSFTIIWRKIFRIIWRISPRLTQLLRY